MVLIIMKKGIVILIAGILCSASSACADDNWAGKLSLEAEIEYAQKYMWRGFDLQEDDPALQPSLTLYFGDTGFYAGIWGNIAFDEEWHEWDEIDYYGGYYHSLCKDSWYAVDWDISYAYYYFPRYPGDVDTYTIALELEFPKLITLLNISGLVPYGAVYYGDSVEGESNDGLWIKLGVKYDLPIPPILTWQKEQALSIYMETFHNDGAQTAMVNPGWSHLATGISTTFKWHGFGFTPGINYQWSREETVNNENDFWYTLKLSYTF